MNVLLPIVVLLAGCAGSQATRWKPPVKRSCTVEICDVRWPEKPCVCSGGLRL